MKWVLAAAFALFAWLSAIAIWIAVEPAQDPSDTADIAIVLGAAVDDDTPSPVFAARIDHAIALYQSGRVKGLLFTGARSPEDSLAESEAARDYAITAGVPAALISIETQSVTTLQNLEQAHTVMRSEDHSDALVVSDPLHLRRASLMASNLGINAQMDRASQTRYVSWSTKAPFLLREVYFIHHFWIFGE